MRLELKKQRNMLTNILTVAQNMPKKMRSKTILPCLIQSTDSTARYHPKRHLPRKCASRACGRAPSTTSADRAWPPGQRHHSRDDPFQIRYFMIFFRKRRTRFELGTDEPRSIFFTKRHVPETKFSQTLLTFAKNERFSKKEVDAQPSKSRSL